MISSLKRRRIPHERAQAVNDRVTAARDLVAAIREAEAAIDAMKAANDRFYRADNSADQAILSSLRHQRERLFAFHVACELLAEAPQIARLLGVRVATARAMPLVDFINHTNQHDLGAVDGQ